MQIVSWQNEKGLNYRSFSEIRWHVQIFALPFTITLGKSQAPPSFLNEPFAFYDIFTAYITSGDTLLPFVHSEQNCKCCWCCQCCRHDNISPKGRCRGWTQNINVLHVICCFPRLRSFYDFTYWLANDFLIKFFFPFFLFSKAGVSSLPVFSSSLSSPALLSTTMMFVLLCFEEQIEAEIDCFWQPWGETLLTAQDVIFAVLSSFTSHRSALVWIWNSTLVSLGVLEQVQLFRLVDDRGG